MLIATAAIVSVVAADQASKALVLSRSWETESNAGFFAIRKMLTRRGAPMFALSTRTLASLWIVALAAAAVLLQRKIIADNAMNDIGIGAALGGAAGNLADRWRRGAVVDFIAIGRWPVFNLADAAIVAGIALLALSFVKT